MNRIFGTPKTNVPSTNGIVTKPSNPYVDEMTSIQSSISKIEQQITIKTKELDDVEKAATNYARMGQDNLALLKLRKKKKPL